MVPSSPKKKKVRKEIRDNGLMIDNTSNLGKPPAIIPKINKAGAHSSVNTGDRRFSNTSNLGSDFHAPTRGNINTAFGLNLKILNPYIIFQKNQTTIIDGLTPFYKTS